MDPIEVSLLQGVPLVAAGWLEGGWQRAIHTYKYRGRSQLAVSLAGILSYVDTPAAGTHTYKVQAHVGAVPGANMAISNCKLVAFEL